MYCHAAGSAGDKDDGLVLRRARPVQRVGQGIEVVAVRHAPNRKPRVERSFWELVRSFFNGRTFRDRADLDAGLMQAGDLHDITVERGMFCAATRLA